MRSKYTSLKLIGSSQQYGIVIYSVLFLGLSFAWLCCDIGDSRLLKSSGKDYRWDKLSPESRKKFEDILERRRIIYIEPSISKSIIFSYETENGKTMPVLTVPPDKEILLPNVDYSGERLAFAVVDKNDWKIEVVQATDQALLYSVSPSIADCLAPEALLWSPDNKRLLAVCKTERDHEALVFSVDSKTISLIDRHPVQHDGSVVFSTGWIDNEHYFLRGNEHKDKTEIFCTCKKGNGFYVPLCVRFSFGDYLIYYGSNRQLFMQLYSDGSILQFQMQQGGRVLSLYPTTNPDVLMALRMVRKVHQLILVSIRDGQIFTILDDAGERRDFGPMDEEFCRKFEGSIFEEIR